MRSLISYLRHTVRRLAQAPAFSINAVLVLGLAIGANTAMFSLTNGVILKPLPYPRSTQLVLLFQPFRTYNEFSFDYPDFVDYAAAQHSFQYLTAVAGDQVNLTGGGAPQRIDCVYVTGSFFDVFARNFVLGRPFDNDQDKSDTAPVVVLSDRFWRKQFQSDPNVIGAQMILNDKSFRVIGVTPEVFNESGKIDVYIPLALSPDFRVMQANRGGHDLLCIGRLKDGTSLVQARADFDRINQNLIAQYPATDKGFGIRLVPYLDTVISDYAGTLWILEVAVGCLLAIACANVANLLLARGQSRQREASIRAALGAGRIRLGAQMLGESLVLAVTGAGIGLLLAWGVLGVIKSLVPESAARFQEVNIEGGVLVFTVSVALLTALAAGVIPIWASLRSDPACGLSEEAARGQTAGRRKHRVQAWLVGGQVALTVCLLIGAGLFSRSFQTLQSVPLGFKPDHLLLADIYLPETRYADEKKRQLFFDSLLSQLRQLPGVVDAGIDDNLPFAGDRINVFGIPGEEYKELIQMPGAQPQYVSPGYFRSLQIPLIRGRLFNDTDQQGADKVVIINQAIVERFFPNQDPVGKQIYLPGKTKQFYTIIGVVANIQHNSAESPRTAFQTYYPSAQSPENFGTVVIRTRGDPRGFIAALQKSLTELDSNLPLSNVRSLDEAIAQSFSARRLSVLVVSLLSGTALLLAAVGLYAVLSYIVGQRTREIGVRITLGAESTNILRLVLRRGLSLVGLGLLTGLAGTLAILPLIQASLYGVSAYDPTAILSAIIVLNITAAIACLAPALRATRINPITALRE
jgi:putative ABC transport system permease protein